MFNFCIGIVVAIIAFTQPLSHRAHGLSVPVDEEEEDSGFEKRSNKLKYSELEHTHLDDDYVKGSLWPKPQEEHKQRATFSFSPEDFTFTTSGAGKDSKVIKSAIERYKKITFPKSALKCEHPSCVKSLEILIRKKNEDLHFDMDEFYQLIVDSPTSKLTANTVWGALRGLETFSQIVHLTKENKYVAYKTNITDWPRFKHRGFLIDTSRHYLPIKIIYKFLDGLSYSKFNVLHWHIVDDPAFPYVSKKFPKLSEKGSRSTSTHVYTPENVQSIIEYARYRGIRIIPEFDTPGHTQSWKAIHGLLTDCGDGNFGPINPTKEKNYKFLEQFFNEVVKVFPDKYLHLGADEVDFTCWKKNSEIKDWMKANHNDTYEELEQYYAERLTSIVDKLQRNYIVWQDIFDNGVKLNSNTIINIWLGGWEKEMEKVTGAGHKAILSACWYLNYINYGMDWPMFYFCDPQDFSGTDDQKKLVLGGTAAMWGEYVDATNILDRTWARGLAVGERLWSNKSIREPKDAMQRIWEHRCRYLKRGIPAEPVVKGKFCIDEWNP